MPKVHQKILDVEVLVRYNQEEVEILSEFFSYDVNSLAKNLYTRFKKDTVDKVLHETRMALIEAKKDRDDSAKILSGSHKAVPIERNKTPTINHEFDTGDNR